MSHDPRSRDHEADEFAHWRTHGVGHRHPQHGPLGLPAQLARTERDIARLAWTIVYGAAAIVITLYVTGVWK